MYTIYIRNGDDDPICIYDPLSPSDKLALSSPKLILEDNSAGSFSMTVPPSNIGFDIIGRLTSDIIVCKKEGSHEETIWTGRVINESVDFYGSRTLECEGALAFLNDTYQPQKKYLINKKGISEANVFKDFLEALLKVHNSSVNDNHKIFLGDVTVKDPDHYLYRYTNFETTLEAIKEKLVDRLGGHIIIRYKNGKAYLDYLQDFHKVDENTQIVEFGMNLLDFTKQWDMSYFASAILPLGKTIEKEDATTENTNTNENLDIDDDDETAVLDEHVTVSSVNEGNLFVKADKKVIDAYGWIAVKVVWDYISKPETLLKKAKDYLENLQFDSMYLEVSAFDMSVLNADYGKIDLLDRVHVFSAPHGLNKLFPVTKKEIPLEDPTGIVFGMGIQVNQPLTGLINNSK